jgi:hypothetical protein
MIVFELQLPGSIPQNFFQNDRFQMSIKEIVGELSAADLISSVDLFEEGIERA